VTQIAFVPPVCVTVHVQVRSEFRVRHSREANLIRMSRIGLIVREEGAAKLAITDQETGWIHGFPSWSGRQRLKIPPLARD
jgi:hypothetical protein